MLSIVRNFYFSNKQIALNSWQRQEKVGSAPFSLLIGATKAECCVCFGRCVIRGLK